MNGTTPIEELYEGYLNNTLSEDKVNEFLSRLQIPEEEVRIDALMQDTWNEMFEQQRSETKIVSMRRPAFYRAAAAAVLILVLGAAAYLVLSKPGHPPLAQSQEQRFKNDVRPGTNAPVLTLADGRTVRLDSSALGQLATQGTVKVTRLPNGEIVYGAITKPSEVRYNTMTNPKGSRVLPLTLTDGTKIWLDAASSITYPTAFLGKERSVEITGQVYFEVKHNLAMPFIVKKANDEAEVQVLGTHFNVMAFDDEEAIKVTLLEGSVKVSKGTNSNIIKPGEQAQVDKGSSFIRVVQNADIDQTMAWKNGIFKFQDITIEPLMKQLARWYDVEVVYEDKPDEHFVSTIPRDVPASQVFKILETTGRVHFKIEGKKVTVMK